VAGPEKQHDRDDGDKKALGAWEKPVPPPRPNSQPPPKSPTPAQPLAEPGKEKK